MIIMRRVATALTGLALLFLVLAANYGITATLLALGIVAALIAAGVLVRLFIAPDTRPQHRK